MKISVAIASNNALPSAFVVWRGFEESIQKAAKMGYDGVELALKNAAEIDKTQLSGWLEKYKMEISCISTGQVFADTGFMFTDPDTDKRDQVKAIFRDIIDLAQDYGQLVNIGRVRGFIGDQKREEAQSFFIETARELCDYALDKNVKMILEPVNRYEIDFINSVEEGVELMRKVDRQNMKLMPDVFHMNIEDRTIGGELARNINFIEYIHFADSNRLAPGRGHTDFHDILSHLKSVGYNGWISLEILPEPDPDTAANQAIDYLKPLIQQYNEDVK
jgi:sugar phosphate isomerase/epimerase